MKFFIFLLHINNHANREKTCNTAKQLTILNNRQHMISNSSATFLPTLIPDAYFLSIFIHTYLTQP